MDEPIASQIKVEFIQGIKAAAEKERMSRALSNGLLSAYDFHQNRISGFISRLVKLMTKFIHNKDNVRVTHPLIRKKPFIPVKVRSTESDTRGCSLIDLMILFLQAHLIRHVVAAKGGSDVKLDEIKPSKENYYIRSVHNRLLLSWCSADAFIYVVSQRCP